MFYLLNYLMYIFKSCIFAARQQAMLSAVGATDVMFVSPSSILSVCLYVRTSVAQTKPICVCFLSLPVCNTLADLQCVCCAPGFCFIICTYTGKAARYGRDFVHTAFLSF